MMLGVCLARAVATELSERERTAAEQRLHQLEQRGLARAMPNHRVLIEPM
jgi:hypothetical protein